MDRKTFSRVAVKDAVAGEVELAFATFNETDADKDVTLPGAFEDGAEVVISSYGHASWGPSRGASAVPVLPIGKGKIRTTKDEAIVDGRFFLDTTGGRETFAVVKELGDLQEWSYGYETLKSHEGEKDGEPVRFLEKQVVFEVSPVLKGAGKTRTLAVKADAGEAFLTPRGLSRALVMLGLKAGDVADLTDEQIAAVREIFGADDAKTAIPYAKAETTTMDDPFDGPAAEANLKPDGDAAYYRSAFAWVDPDADATTKAAYRFIHHDVSADGTVGAANVRACLAGITVLNGARGGTTIPDGDRAGVYAHLAKHLSDAGLEAPDLKAAVDLEDEDGGDVLRFSDEAAKALAAVDGFAARARALAAVREKEGRVISSTNRSRLSTLRERTAEILAEIDSLLKETEPGKLDREIGREFLRFERERSSALTRMGAA